MGSQLVEIIGFMPILLTRANFWVFVRKNPQKRVLVGFSGVSVSALSQR